MRVIEEMLKMATNIASSFRRKSAHNERAEGKEEFLESLRDLIRRAQREGAIDTSLPLDWVLGTMGAMVATAIRLIGTGELARNHAAALITRTLFDGVGASLPGSEIPHS